MLLVATASFLSLAYTIPHSTLGCKWLRWLAVEFLAGIVGNGCFVFDFDGALLVRSLGILLLWWFCIPLRIEAFIF